MFTTRKFVQSPLGNLPTSLQYRYTAGTLLIFNELIGFDAIFSAAGISFITKISSDRRNIELKPDSTVSLPTGSEKHIHHTHTNTHAHASVDIYRFQS